MNLFDDMNTEVTPSKTQGGEILKNTFDDVATPTTSIPRLYAQEIGEVIKDTFARGYTAIPRLFDTLVGSTPEAGELYRSFAKKHPVAETVVKQILDTNIKGSVIRAGLDSLGRTPEELVQRSLDSQIIFGQNPEVRQAFRQRIQETNPVEAAIGNTIENAPNLIYGQLGALARKAGPAAGISGGFLSAIPMYTQEYDSMVQMMDDTKNPDGTDAIPDDIKLKYGTKYAWRSTIVEYVQTLTYLSPVNKEKMLKKALRAGGKPFYQRLMAHLAKMGLNLASESIEEVIQAYIQHDMYNQAVEETNARLSTSIPLRDVKDAEKDAKQGAEAAVGIGIVTELLGASAHASSRYRSYRQNLKDLKVDEMKIKEESSKIHSSISALQRDALQQESDDTLQTRALQISDNNLGMNLDEVIDKNLNPREALIEFILKNDEALQEQRLEQVRQRVANSELSPWDKFIMLLSEDSKLVPSEGAAFRVVMEGLHGQLQARGEVKEDFDTWLNNTLRMEMEKTDYLLFQREKAVPNTALDPRRLPLSFRKELMDISYGTDKEVNLELRVQHGQAALAFFYQTVQPGKTIEEIEATFRDSPILSQDEKDAFVQKAKELVAFTKDGVFLKPESFTKQQELVNQVQPESVVGLPANVEGGSVAQSSGLDIVDQKIGFAQTGEQYASGSSVLNAVTRFYANKTAYIRLFQTGDFSSLTHEIAHVMTMYLTDAQISEIAKQVSKANPALSAIAMEQELKIFRDNPAAENLLVDGNYSATLEAAQEYFARSFEQYMHTGKAPNFFLKKSYREYAKFMRKTYSTISDIPNLNKKLDPKMRMMFDTMIAGGQQFKQGAQMPFNYEGKKYTTYVSHPKLEAHRIMLRRIEQGLTEVAGMRKQLEEYAETMLGSHILVKTKRGMERKPNPSLKDPTLLLRLEKLRTQEDAYNTVAYIDNMLYKEELSKKKAVIEDIKKTLKEIDWKKLDSLYKSKLLETVQDIDFTKMSDKKLHKLTSLKEAILRNSKEGNIDTDLLEIPLSKLKELSRLEKTNVYDMSIEDLELLRSAIRTHIQLHTLKTNILTENILTYLNEWQQKASKQMDWAKDKEEFKFGVSGVPLNERRVRRWLKMITTVEVRNPENTLLYLADFDEDAPTVELFKLMSEGGTTARAWMQKNRDFMQGLSRKVEIGTWSKLLGRVGSRGVFPEFKESNFVKIRQKVFNPDTGEASYKEITVPCSEAELKNLPTTDSETYQIQIDGKYVNISQNLYAAFLEPEKRINSDHVYLKVTDEKGAAYLLPVTRAERLTLYLYSMNEKALEHILVGGFRDRRNPTWIYHLSKETIAEIKNTLSNDEKYVAEQMIYYFNNVIKPAINKVSKALVLHEIANEDMYFPLYISAISRGTSAILNKPELSATSRAFVKQMIERQGFLKERTGNEAPIWLMDAFEAMSVNLEGVSRYLGYAKPIRIARAVIEGNKDLPDSFFSKVSRKWDPETANSLVAWLDHIEDDSYYQEPALRGFRAMSEAQTRAVLAANLYTALVQRFSLDFALNYGISQKNLLKAKARAGIMGKYSVAELMALHPDFYERYLHGFNVELYETKIHNRTKTDWGLDMQARTQMMNLQSKADFRQLTNNLLRDKTIAWIYRGDSYALSTIWDAAQMQIKEEYAHLDGETQHKMALDLMRLIVRRTQPDYLIENMSPLLSTKDFWVRTIVAKFNNQRFKIHNEREYHSRKFVHDYRLAGSQGEKAKLAASYINKMWRLHISVNFSISLLRQLLAELGRDPDAPEEDTSFAMRTFIGTIENAASTYPILGPVVVAMFEAGTKGRYNSMEMSNIIQSALTNIAFSFGEAGGDLSDGDILGAVGNALTGCMYLTGLIAGYPLLQIKKDITYAIRALEKIVD